MEFLSKLKSSLKRSFTVLCAAVMALTSGILTGTEFTASGATLHGAAYLNEALNQASGGKYREPLETWQAFLDVQSKTDYYKGTPYSSWLYAASPKGDLWQRNEGYSSKIGASGGMNCTGFVWHIISNGLAKGSGKSITETGTWTPNSNGFNAKGFSRSCWTNGSWYKFITRYNVRYYEFGTKSEMLSSGVLQKGDIIWCVNASQGSGLAGLSNPDSYHHIGIYMGDGKSDSWWQSGPVNGDGNSTGEINSINQIYGKATKNTYVVIPWAEGAKPTFDPYKIAIAKVDAETGKATAQGDASLEGAEFTLKYYSGTSATGTPTKTWVIKTDINGKAKLDSQHLKSGTLFVDSNGKAYIPLGTVTIQETKAPTGYKINNTINTIHIIEKDGKAIIQTEGASTYLQEYTDTVSESIIRGNLKLEKQNGETGEEFAYIPFLLTNDDTGEKHLLLTDKNGVIDTSLNRDKANILDDYLSGLTFNTSNELTLDIETMMNMVSDTSYQAAGVWFGDGSVSTTNGALPYGAYTLKEIRCEKNKGFHLIDRSFQITASQTSINLGTLIDTTAVGVIRGKKVDPDGNGLSGAVIGLFAKDTTKFTAENTYTGMTAVSGNDGSFAFENVPKGEYIVREIAPPDGYLLSEQSYPVTVKVNEDGEEVLLGEDIVNTPTTVELTKVDENGNSLSGAKLQIIGPDSKPVADWTSDGTVHTVTGKLAVGKTYIYNEYVAPDGYVKGDLIYFTIQADGTVTDLDGNPIQLEMVNTATVVEISKLDEDENHLAGAVMQIIDKAGKVVDEWTTDGKVHTLVGKLKAGAAYTLHEVSAPDGYYREEDMTFTVGADGTASVGMTDYATYAGIRKRDDQGKSVAGAVLQILDKDRNVVEEWTTTADEPIHKLEAVLNPDETYTLHEVSAPKGYFLADDITFQVAEKGTLASAISMIDVHQGSLIVGKLSDIQEQPESGEIIWLPGAVMQVQDLQGNTLDEWTTDSKQHTIEATLTPGESYILHEVSAPDGYCVAEDIQFTLDEKGQIVKSNSYASGGAWIRMTDLATKIEIQKTDETDTPLSGAALQVVFTDADGKETVIDSWTTNGSVHQIYGKLIAGETYTLREVSVPAGYAKAADQQFTVGTDGKVQTITMKDIATKVGVDKVDEDGSPLKGAVLQIIDAAGTKVDEWTTDGTTHRIDAALIAGAEYILHEVSAPAEYVVAADQKFTVNADGSLTGVKMVNVSTKVQISKTTITGDTELPGAKLEVRDLSGNVLDSWTSGSEAHRITAKLTAGQTYILHETAAPNGYVVASDIEFTVNKDAAITKVTMKDDTTKVEVNKVTEDNKPLSGAKMQIIDKAGKTVDEWTTDGTVHVLTAKLTAGQTYTLHEVSAPAGYVISPDQQFTVNTDGSVTSVSMTDLATVVRIDKVDPDGNPLKGANLQILDENEKVLEEWTTDGTVHEIKAKLAAGKTYTLRETASPAGYYVSKDSAFTVNLDGTPNAITLYNVMTKVSITKYDITGENPLPGALLQVKDTKGNVLEEWTSGTDAHIIEGVLVSGGTYVLHEVSAPDGYVLASDMQFTVNPDGTITTVSMKDDTTKVSVTKKDITGENELAGAALEIRDADENIIDSWISDGTPHVISGILVAGATYTLHEVSAPDGFVIAKDVAFTVDADGNVTNVTMLDDTTKVSITKYDITGENELAGASLEVRDADENIIDSWISDGTAHQIIGVLAVGQTYTLHEVAAPNGFVVAKDIAFQVNADGSTTIVNMYDDTTKVHITKYEITGQQELPGASLELKDSDGTVIDAWISGSEAHEIIGVLTAGAEYTLHEVAAPNGYVVANDVTFTVNTDGSVNVVSMYDDTTKVSITKQDITTGAALAGATLQIVDANETVLEEWISTEEAHMIEAVLTAGETYTLRETAAPNGYVIAEEIPFTVNPDGTVTAVVMQDDVTKVSISKYDITGENELAGASMEVKDAQGNVVDAWISDGTAHEINGVLIAGAEYTLHEVTSPDGYVVASDVTFTVHADGSVTPVSMYDYPTVVHISKKDITTGEELPGAFLELYDKDNNLMDSWVSTNEAHIIEAVLIAGEKYTLIETSAPNGYVISEKVDFTVNLDNTITHVDMFDDTTKVQLSKKSITGDEELPGASMQLLDKNGGIVDEWISGTEPHLIEGVLIAGETYTLHEVSAPNGHVLANDITFTVSTDGTVDVITMTDDTTKVEISKTDITGENPVSGALLQLKDKEGNLIHEWISGKDVNYLEADLTAGETYILHEEAAPNGFVVSEDMEFTVNTDGTINKIQMKDDTTKVSITKYDITSGEELPGAALQIIDKDGNVIEEWISGTEAHLITGILTAGETYTLREITAPDGWTVTEDVTFTVDTDGSITHVEMFDKPTSVSIRKVDASGNAVSGAVMQLLDKEGNVVEEWTTDGTAHVLTAKLIAGETYTLHEVSAPAGYELAKDQTFTVDENGRTTEFVMVDEKTPVVPVATPTTPASSTASSPKTGDAMPVMAVGTGLLASFLLMLLARKKKRKGKAA